MKFHSLQENLRKAMVERIDGGQLSGLGLARLTGFKQAHISNFLNRKRSLSVEGMDKVLATQHMSIFDLLDPSELNKRASVLAPKPDEFGNVALTDRNAATEPYIPNQRVRHVLKFRKSFLHRLRADMDGHREHWERFVAFEVDKYDGASMHPRLQFGSTVLVDRHYNSLKPYRKGDTNIYAVRRRQVCSLTYAELVGGKILLRPHNQAFPVEILELEAGKSPGDSIIGRVCCVQMEP
jgi:hypothetical protein